MESGLSVTNVTVNQATGGVKEFNLQDINWYELDISSVIEGAPVSHPDLSHIDEIGFTDLNAGRSKPGMFQARLDRGIRKTDSKNEVMNY